jgi:hypothetical protein
MIEKAKVIDYLQKANESLKKEQLDLRLAVDKLIERIVALEAKTN